jgi:hypothetical protein
MKETRKVIDTEKRGELFATVESISKPDFEDCSFDTWVEVKIRHAPTNTVLHTERSAMYTSNTCDSDHLLHKGYKITLEEAFTFAAVALRAIRGKHIVAESDNKHTANQSRPWSIAPESNIADILIKRVDTAMLDVQREIVDKLAIRAYDMDVIGLIERDQLLGLCDMLSDMIVK